MITTVLHIPHSSTLVPDEYRHLFMLSDEQLQRELLRMTDSYTDELFKTDAKQIIAPVSRLVCDMERFRDDKNESMAKRGMGVCYQSTSDLTPMKTVTDAHREEILARYYDPHHQLLEKTVRNALARGDRCLVLDCHSFASSPLPYEPNQEKSRPDICLGTDPFHTPSNLTDALRAAFEVLGYRVQENDPYAGTLIPMFAWQTDKRVMGVMIEINRSLYMNESTGEKMADFSRLQAELHSIISYAEKIASAVE